MIPRILRRLRAKYRQPIATDLEIEHGRALAEDRPMAVEFRAKRYFINADGSACYHAQNSFEKIHRLANCIPANVDVVFDVGANCGLFSCMVKENNPHQKIYAFEPSLALHPSIRKNCGDEVVIIPKAATEQEGVDTFYINTLSQQTNSLNKAAVIPFSTGILDEVTVETTSLDAVWRQQSLHGNAAIKIDVQGAESRVLAGSELVLETTEMLLIESTWLDTSSVELALMLFDRFPYRYAVNSVHFGADLAFCRSPIDDREKSLHQL